MRAKDNRPGEQSQAVMKAFDGATTILPESIPGEFLQLADGVLVVVVRVTPVGDSEPRYRRRIFLSLASAQRHAELARVRGHEARVILARLQPVSGVKL